MGPPAPALDELVVAVDVDVSLADELGVEEVGLVAPAVVDPPPPSVVLVVALAPQPATNTVRSMTTTTAAGPRWTRRLIAVASLGGHRPALPDPLMWQLDSEHGHRR